MWREIKFGLQSKQTDIFICITSGKLHNKGMWVDSLPHFFNMRKYWLISIKYTASWVKLNSKFSGSKAHGIFAFYWLASFDKIGIIIESNTSWTPLNIYTALANRYINKIVTLYGIKFWEDSE